MLLGLSLIFFGYCLIYIAANTVKAIAGEIPDWLITIEDIIVASLSGLSLILIIYKSLTIVPLLASIGIVTTSFILVTFLSTLIFYKVFSLNYRLLKPIFLYVQLPQLKHFYWFSSIFILYLLRAFFKAKDITETIYISSRYNTDIFLYLRRISVFLNENVAWHHQYDGVAAIDILYDSPKLLSSLIYAIFTDIFKHPGIAGTILTSLILTAIVLKYILLLQDSYTHNKLLYISVIIFVFFLPAFSWLQDQFYLSNLLYLYLLIYAVEDLLIGKYENKIVFKFGISAIATAGFYPSQLPFLMGATVILLLLSKQKRSSKVINIIKVSVITFLTLLIFLPQYLATTEVTQHFIVNSQLGVNLVYTPFWSILTLVPKPGGFKISIGSITLIIFSIIICVTTAQYLARKFKIIARYLYLSSLLYIIYSLSFLIFTGSYRQGKFFVTYIIPLILFCFIKIITQIKSKTIVTAIMLLLTIYVGYNSLDRKYKSHLSHDIQLTIEEIKKLDKPVVIYKASLDHRFYYLSFQLKKLPLNIITHCPSLKEIEDNIKTESTNLVSSACNQKSFKDKQNKIIKLD